MYSGRGAAVLMEEKYKQLHLYLDELIFNPDMALHLTDEVISQIAQWFTLSKAEVIAGTIQFCKEKGIEVYFHRTPPPDS